MDESKIQVLLSEEKIQSRVQEMGREITEKFKGEELVVVGILKGSFIFLADLVREIKLPLSVEFMGVSSYGDKKTSSGEVKVTLDLNHPVHGKNVLLVEDIIDSGLTMSYLQRNLQARGPKRLATATFLYKPEALKTHVKLDFVGFKIGNEFVIGYGLDYAGHYRNLPYLAQFID